MPMAKADETGQTTPKKRSKMPLVLGVGLALAGGGAGFYAVDSGLLPLPESNPADAHAAETGNQAESASGAADVAFVPIEPLVISLNDSAGTHLRFRAQLEVAKSERAQVEHLMPRIVDVLNGYLRAVEVADLRDNAALFRLRAQMLRRVRVVAGADRVGDLLVMEFVLN